MAETQQQYITPEMKAKLEAELQQLIDNRPVIAAEINERREEGDLKENAGYDAAREQQDQEEARIKQISELMANSTTERAGVVDGVALVGSVLHVYYNGDEDDKETFLSAPAQPPSTTSTWRPTPSSPRSALPCSARRKARPAPTRLRTAARFRSPLSPPTRMIQLRPRLRALSRRTVIQSYGKREYPHPLPVIEGFLT